MCKTGWGGVCGRCAGSPSGVCVHSRPRLSVQGAWRGVLRPIHHPERIEPGGYGGVTGASAPRSYPLHFRPSRARPRRLPEGSIHHRGRGHGGGAGGGAAGCRVSGRTPGKSTGHVERRRQGPGDACGAQSPAGGPRGVTLPAAPEGGLISFPRAAEVSAKCLSHLFKFYGAWPVAAGLRPGRKRVPGRRGSAGRGWPRQAGRGSCAGPRPSELFGLQGGASMSFSARPRPLPLAPSRPHPLLLLSGCAMGP